MASEFTPTPEATHRDNARDITVEEILFEIEQQGENPEGLTTAEWGEKCHRHREWVLENLVRKGYLEFAGRRRIVTADQRGGLVPVYRLVRRKT